MAKDRSRDFEVVDVLGPDGRIRKKKRFQAEDPVVRAMGFRLLGEGGIPILEEHLNGKRKGGRKSNAEKENEVLLQRIAELEAKLNATPNVDADQV